MPSIPVTAVAATSVTVAPLRGAPVRRSVTHARKVFASTNESTPRPVAWTQDMAVRRRRSCLDIRSFGSTDTMSWPRPPSSQGARFTSRSAHARPAPGTLRSISATRSPGGLMASSDQRRPWASCHSVQSAGRTACTCTRSCLIPIERTASIGAPFGSRIT